MSSTLDIHARNTLDWVRLAFVKAARREDPDLRTAWLPLITRGVESATESAWTAKTGWVEKDPYTVVVYSECCPPRGTPWVLRDPYRSGDRAAARIFDAAVEELKRNSWVEDAGWDSINPAVQMVWVRPRIIG